MLTFTKQTFDEVVKLIVLHMDASAKRRAFVTQPLQALKSHARWVVSTDRTRFVTSSYDGAVQLVGCCGLRSTCSLSTPFVLGFSP